jgi:large subunit ribosomal protein L15
MSMIHELTDHTPRNKRPRRKGRGESSGRGKTSGRGNKGAKARQGTYIKRGHEGGQTPIFRRFPKRGFSNFVFKRRFHIVNLSELESFENGSTVDSSALREAGLIPNDKQPVKILGDGEFKKKLTVLAGWYSKGAHAKILAAGGTANNASGQTFEFPKPVKKFVPRLPAKKPKIAEESDQAAADAKAKAPAKSETQPEVKTPAEDKPEAPSAPAQ